MERRRLLAGIGALAALGCAGLRGPAEQPLSFSADDHRREALLVCPPGPGPLPLVVAAHGNGGSPRELLDTHGWRPALAAAGWAGVFLATGAAAPNRDGNGDVAGLRGALDAARAAIAVDRVAAVGFSGGARSVYRFAVTYPDALFAIMAASGVVAMAGDAAPPRGARLSVLHVHGGRDDVVPFAGGPIRAADGQVREAAPTDAALAAWADALGASREAEVDGPGGARILRWRAPDGRGVQRVWVPDLGHGWHPSWGAARALAFFAAAPR